MTARALRIFYSILILITNSFMSVWHLVVNISKSLWIIPLRKLFFSFLGLEQNLYTDIAFYRGISAFLNFRGDPSLYIVVFFSLNCLWVFLGLLVVTILSLSVLWLRADLVKCIRTIFWLVPLGIVADSDDWNLEYCKFLEFFLKNNLILSSYRQFLPLGESSILFVHSKGMSYFDLNMIWWIYFLRLNVCPPLSSVCPVGRYFTWSFCSNRLLY